ncbi:hypothetical protein HDU83_000218 [Entophlyctis luteolus]|nr:hypothetical protein HDU83_000218 [Entophlyctis luteolus]
MARSSGLITTACCPNDAVVSPPHRIPSSLNKRRVSFNKQLISSVQFTHAATDYDRKSIVIQPMTSKDLAALYVFKLSLSMHRHERKHQLLQPPAPRQQTQAAKSNRAAAAADLSTKFKEKVSAPISDEDWIESIAQSARNTLSSGQYSDNQIWETDESMWDTVEKCCYQIMRF